jgi:hypothetical protein
MLTYALTHYHYTLKRLIEDALAAPDLLNRISTPDRRGKVRVSQQALSRLLYTLAPKGWPLAPLRDYLIGDAAAMLLSHFKKQEKGKHLSNPPTLSGLEPMTESAAQQAYAEFATTVEFPLKPQQIEKIENMRDSRKTRVAERVEKVYQNWAASRAAGEILRKMDSGVPRPIEFTRPEFERGYLLARKGDNFYLLVRLFAKGHRYCGQKVMEDGFVNWRTGELIAGRKFPGLILPVELGRDYHDHEYLQNGKPQSAKLLMKRGGDGQEEFYAHITFEFTPEPMKTETILGIDRGAAKIGAASVIDMTGKLIASQLDLEGAAFAVEMARLGKRIADAQRKGHQRGRVFRLRGRKADSIIGEYANRLVSEAVKCRSQIALEKVDSISMARFLTQSQFRKLHDALAYKAERVGLPPPIEVPAAYTSQTCSKCGNKAPENRPKHDSEGKAIQDVFRCTSCGFEANADDNASEVIALRALHQQMNGGRFQKFDQFQEWLKKERVGTA